MNLCHDLLFRGTLGCEPRPPKYRFETFTFVVEGSPWPTQYSKEPSMILVRCSAPSSPATSPIPGAKSKTLRCGKVPFTSIATSLRLYPTAFSPRGTPRLSRKRAIASYKWAPMSRSGMLVTDVFVTVVELKIARTSRWRSGDDGAVNWKTKMRRYQYLYDQMKCEDIPAGPVRATLCDGNVRRDALVHDTAWFT